MATSTEAHMVAHSRSCREVGKEKLTASSLAREFVSSGGVVNPLLGGRTWNVSQPVTRRRLICPRRLGSGVAIMLVTVAGAPMDHSSAVRQPVRCSRSGADDSCGGDTAPLRSARLQLVVRVAGGTGRRARYLGSAAAASDREAGDPMVSRASHCAGQPDGWHSNYERPMFPRLVPNCRFQ